MISTIGAREAEKALQLGTLYKPKEALAVNLVDEVVEPAELLSKAQDQIQKWIKIPSKNLVLRVTIPVIEFIGIQRGLPF